MYEKNHHQQSGQITSTYGRETRPRYAQGAYIKYTVNYSNWPKENKMRTVDNEKDSCRL